MDVAERSRDRVEELLGALDERYESFPVRQTTVSVPAESYEHVAELCCRGTARIDVHCRNDEGEVLLVEGDAGPCVPGGLVDPEDSLATHARRLVREDTGVRCRIEGVEESTIVGVRDESDPDAAPVFRLVTLFAGRPVAGSPGEGSRWDSETPATQLVR